jgi:hypothetical protein
MQGSFGYGICAGFRWCELKKHKGRENHEKAFSERGGYFSIVKLSYAHVVTFGKVKADFFPSLSHGWGKISEEY